MTQWLVAASLAALTWAALLVIRRLISGRLTALAASTSGKWDDLIVAALNRTKTFFFLTVSVVVGAQALTLPPRVASFLGHLMAIVLLVQAGIWASLIAKTLLDRYAASRAEGDRGAATMVGAFGFLVQLLVWTAVFLLVLSNLGIDITALIAGLGVGGIAIALATQNILGDLLASLAIVLDKPFAIKDFIIVGDLMGSVEHIGLKTTRVRSLSGEQLVFSNADLLSSRIRNYGRMFERRVVLSIGVEYETPRQKLEQVPGILKEAIEAQEGTRFDRSHFATFGSFSLDFESVYYVLTPDFNRHMDIQQAINFRIHERFEAEGIGFAYPTQRLLLERRVDPSREDDSSRKT
ncbi:MAG: mechanosensitive ion channel family protein [Gemmatimonadales bacterium]